VLKRLTRVERLRLMRFVCAFAWADLRVQQPELEFVAALSRQLELEPAEIRQVEAWLQTPPAEEEIDPGDIPPEHRQMFLNVVRVLTHADGRVFDRERESIALLTALLEGEPA
jgi:hypothetical protein